MLSEHHGRSSCARAVAVLAKHHGGFFWQLLRSLVLGVATTLQHEIQKLAALLQGVLTRSEQRAATAFAQAPEDHFDV